MSDRHNTAARDAYYAFTGELRRRLTAKNGMMEIARFDEAEATIDESACTFQLVVRNVDKVPSMLPATGKGWQLVGGEWSRRPVSEVTATGVCQSPPCIDGLLLVSYRWTWWSWMKAQIYWMWRMLLRFLGWLLILGFLFLVVWIVMRLPWRTMAAFVGSALSRVAQTTTATPQPTSTVRPARAGYQGRPPNVSPK